MASVRWLRPTNVFSTVDANHSIEAHLEVSQVQEEVLTIAERRDFLGHPVKAASIIFKITEAGIISEDRPVKGAMNGEEIIVKGIHVAQIVEQGIFIRLCWRILGLI